MVVACKTFTAMNILLALAYVQRTLYVGPRLRQSLLTLLRRTALPPRVVRRRRRRHIARKNSRLDGLNVWGTNTATPLHRSDSTDSNARSAGCGPQRPQTRAPETLGTNVAPGLISSEQIRKSKRNLTKHLRPGCTVHARIYPPIMIIHWHTHTDIRVHRGRHTARQTDAHWHWHWPRRKVLQPHADNKPGGLSTRFGIRTSPRWPQSCTPHLPSWSNSRIASVARPRAGTCRPSCRATPPPFGTMVWRPDEIS